jgi:hypothetical protein
LTSTITFRQCGQARYRQAHNKRSPRRSQGRPGRCRWRTATWCLRASTSSSREARRRNRKDSRETIAERIVSMPATISRSAQNSNVYGAYRIMSRDRAAVLSNLDSLESLIQTSD